MREQSQFYSLGNKVSIAENVSFHHAETIRISPGCAIGSGVVFVGGNDRETEPAIDLGANVTIGPGCYLQAERGHIRLGENVRIGPHCAINANGGGIEIDKDAQLGFSCHLTGSSGRISIGQNTIIGNFTMIRVDQGEIAVGLECELGDYVRLSADGERGRVFIEEKAKIDSGNEVNGSGYVHIGPKSHLWSGSYINAFEGPIDLEYQVTLGQKCVLAGRGQIRIGRMTMIGGLTSIVSENHLFAHPFKPIREQGFEKEGITIDSDAWIAARCIVLDGVYVGSNAMVGGGAVVTHDIPPYKMALGVPARVVRDRRAAFAEALVALRTDPENIELAGEIALVGSDALLEWLTTKFETEWERIEFYLREDKGMDKQSVSDLRTFLERSFQGKS